MALTRTLHLTSPTMKGAEVKHAQELLRKNVFHTDFLQGAAIDGEFGEYTERACERAHYWVGDVVSQPVIGPRLEQILTGKLKLDPDNAKRRASRIAAAKHAAANKPLGVKMLEALTTKLGVKESPPNSNHCWATEWYGLDGPWCAMSASWAGVKAGSKAFVKGHSYAYVPYIVNDGRAGRNHLAITHNPVPGDLVCYDWDGGVADHVGLFQEWRSRKDGLLIAVEGNTGHGNDSNGGEVMRRGEGDDHRSIRSVQAFVHVLA
jgi:hypothetical protein